MIQSNTTIEDGYDEGRYTVGARLIFVAYDAEEVAYLASDGRGDGPFMSGDTLVVLEHNTCGMGIDVMRESDGRIDMVWANEVELT